jgi:hypothetical protein
MKTLVSALALALSAGAALAHEGPAAHVHPHGGEAVLAALAVMAAVAALAWARRRSGRD